MILVISDDPDDSVSTIQAIQTSGDRRSIVVMKCGDAALDWLRDRASCTDPTSSGPPELVVVGHRPPELDGIDLLLRTRSEPMLERIPIIVVGDDATGVPGGVSLARWLQRPVRPDRMARAMWSLRPDVS